jgi:exodeoxyribonuclease-3
MKIISWNINGLRSILNKKYLYNLITDLNPDILCLGETKLNNSLYFENNFLDYYVYYNNSKSKKGYSGTAIYTKIKPLEIIYDCPDLNNDEGRVITFLFSNFYLVHVYTPNSGQALQRLEYRINEWDINFNKFIMKLKKIKPVILCGDLNVAHKEIDLKNPLKNLRTAGYTIEERDSFNNILNHTKLIDTYRYFNPELIKYSYWSYRFKSREKNIGWRIDYFLVSKKLLKYIIKSDILEDVKGSDHAPILLEIKI